MTEVFENREENVSWEKIGWKLGETAMLISAFVALAYGYYYLGKSEVLVPGFAALLMAIYIAVKTESKFW